MMRKHNIHKAIIFSMALFLIKNVDAQTPGLGTWNLINFSKDFDSKWTSFFEAQIRSQQLYNNFFYHEYKGGFGYNIAKNFNATLAAGQYVYYTPVGNLKSVTSSEFRLFQQFTLKDKVGRVKVDHRFRVEQRWTAENYRNRYRYRLSATIPVNKKEVEKGALYLNVSDEIFLTNTKSHFERNRLFGAIGYQFTDVFALQGGIMHQYDYRSSEITLKDYLHMSLLFSFEGRKTKSREHPDTRD